MTNLTKIDIEIKDGLVSIIKLSPEQFQEIWDRCSKIENNILEKEKEN